MHLVARICGRHWITVAADKVYDERELVTGLRAMQATPHMASGTFFVATARRLVDSHGRVS